MCYWTVETISFAYRFNRYRQKKVKVEREGYVVSMRNQGSSRGLRIKRKRSILMIAKREREEERESERERERDKKKDYFHFF